MKKARSCCASGFPNCGGRKRRAEDRQELFWLDRRMAALSQMLRQTNELAALTAHYYERGYYRNESYRI